MIILATERESIVSTAYQDLPVIPLETELDELRTNIRDMELRYECTSEYMWNAVLAGTERETDEICLWLMDYRRLQTLMESDAYAALNGTRTTS